MDGSYHEVDSSEMAFSIAGSMAFKDAMRKADPIITEPIMKVAVIVPDEYLGDVIGDLNARRGQIQGMEAMAGTQRVNAFVPLAQMFGYATDLRSKTQGRGQYVMERLTTSRCLRTSLIRSSQAAPRLIVEKRIKICRGSVAPAKFPVKHLILQVESSRIVLQCNSVLAGLL